MLDDNRIWKAEDRRKADEIRRWSDVADDVVGFWRSHWSECLDEGVRAEVKAMIEGKTVASLTAAQIAHLRSLIKSENFVG